MPSRNAEQWAKERRRELERIRKDQGYDGLQPGDVEYIARGKAQIAAGGEEPDFDIPRAGRAPGPTAREQDEEIYERRLKARTTAAEFRAEREHRRQQQRDRARGDARADRSASDAWGGPPPDDIFGVDPGSTTSGTQAQPGDWRRNRDRFGRFSPGGTTPAARKRSPRTGQPGQPGPPPPGQPAGQPGVSSDGMAPVPVEDDPLSDVFSSDQPAGTQPGSYAADYAGKAARAKPGYRHDKAKDDRDIDIDIVVNTDGNVTDGASEVNVGKDGTVEKKYQPKAIAVDRKSGKTRIAAYDRDGDGDIDTALINSDGKGNFDTLVKIDKDGEVTQEMKLPKGASGKNKTTVSESEIEASVDGDMAMIKGGGLRTEKGKSKKTTRKSGEGKARRRTSRSGGKRSSGKMFSAMVR